MQNTPLSPAQADTLRRAIEKSHGQVNEARAGIRTLTSLADRGLIVRERAMDRPQDRGRLEAVLWDLVTEATRRMPERWGEARTYLCRARDVEASMHQQAWWVTGLGREAYAQWAKKPTHQ